MTYKYTSFSLLLAVCSFFKPAGFLIALFITLIVTLGQPSIVIASGIPERISFQNVVENKDFIMGEGTAFLQDSEGYMWLGGGTALIRYDGYEFRQLEFTVEGEKSDEKYPVQAVNDIFEDSHRSIWVATRAGLLRYDPSKEKLIKIKNDSSQNAYIATADIFSIAELPSGEILVGSRSGLFIIDSRTNQYAIFMPENKNENWRHDTVVYSIQLDPDGKIWLGTDVGLICVNWKTRTIQQHRINTDDSTRAQEETINFVASGGDGTLWLATFNGVVQYDPKTHQSMRYTHNPSDPFSVGGNDVRRLLLDSQGILWLATDGGGLSIYDKKNDHFVNYQAESGRAGSLNSNKIRTVYEDKSGDIWVGNFPVGVNFFDRSTAAISTYAANPTNPNSLSNMSVLSVSEDKQGNLWLGTDGGGLDYFDRNKNEFTHFKNNPNDPTSLNGDSVLATLIDAAGIIWVGTWGNGLASYNPADKKFTRYPFVSQKNESISEISGVSPTLNAPSVWSIKEDRQHNLWIGTHSGGLVKFSPQTKLFTHYKPVANDATSISDRLVWTTLEDTNGDMWVGTSAGLNLMKQDQVTFTRFIADSKDPGALSNSNVISILEDSEKRLWFGTGSGLNLYNRETKKFTVYNKKSGFLDDTILGILEDPEGIIWVSTNNGFSSFNPDTKKIKNYNRIGGRLIGGFGRHSGAVSRRGEIILGGVSGLRIFDPRSLSENKIAPPVALTDFKIFTDSIVPGDDDGILKNNINHTDSITLDYTKSMFAFSFSALNFRDSEKNKYAYKLEGFDKDWLNVGNQRTAKYTNLDAGDYVFKVKASNNDGVWNEEGTSVKVRILPPFWKSWVAYVLYALTMTVFIASMIMTQRKKLANSRKKIMLERALNEKMRNLDSLKENFLANTSHELRTPLNGIIGLAESIKTSCGEMSVAEVEKKASMILYSGKRLANIVNDILEFSQLANNELELSLGSVQLRAVITKVIVELKDRISDKSLVILCNIADDILVLSNEYRLVQIIHHLLENAIKFTRDGSITIAHQQDAMFDKISVSDTGIGISPENINSIFDAFQQVDGSAKRAVEGAGLGLSVIQKLVALHKGTMTVESVVGKGTSFHIWLPRLPDSAKIDVAENINNSANVNTEKNSKAMPNSFIEKTHKVHNVYFNSHLYSDESSVTVSVNPGKTYKILVVDDDPVNRMVVKAHLRKQHFNTVEAIDGEDALKIIAEQRDIDLVVLDVMMPHMTGYEVCSLLRKQYSLHEFPVIFLTANHQLSEVVNAFIAGGNDFLTKPVVGNILVDKVKVHLSLLEECKYIDAQLNNSQFTNSSIEGEIAEHQELIHKDFFDVSANSYISLEKAVAKIVEQVFCLVLPVEKIGCWICDKNNSFVCIENTSAAIAISGHAPLSWREMEAFRKCVDNENVNITLVHNLISAAKSGRLGESFVDSANLHCELIFRNNFIVGFIILSSSTAEFVTPECQAILLQCQMHIVAAVTKMNNIKLLELKSMPSH